MQYYTGCSNKQKDFFVCDAFITNLVLLKLFQKIFHLKYYLNFSINFFPILCIF